MRAILGTILGLIVTTIIPLVSNLILTLLNSFLLYPIMKIKPKGYENLGIYTIQSITYAEADFLGLFLGVLILKKFNILYALPILFVPIIVSSLNYVGAGFRFETRQAERLNIGQKCANLVGAIMAIVLTLIIADSYFAIWKINYILMGVGLYIAFGIVHIVQDVLQPVINKPHYLRMAQPQKSIHILLGILTWLPLFISNILLYRRLK